MNVDLSVRVFPNVGRMTFARAHDLSCGGMALYVPLDLELGEVVKVAFELPNSRMQFNVAGAVKNRTGFRYGVEFTKLSHDELREIARVTEILSLTHQS